MSKLKIIGSCILVFLWFVGSAQSPTDSFARKLLDLSNQNVESGDYGKALVNSEQGLKVLLSGVTYNDTLEIKLLRSIGSILYNLRHLEESIKYGNNVLQKTTLLYGIGSNEVGSALNDLGIYYEVKGDYDTALGLYKTALETYKQSELPRKDFISMTYNNIGICYSRQGNPKEANQFFVKCKDIEIALFGTNSLEVASSYFNIASNFLKIKTELPQVYLYLQKALNIFRTQLPSNHPKFANSYQNLAYYYLQNDSIPQALEYIEKSLQIRLEKFGPTHPRVAALYDIKGDCYLFLQSYSEALKFYNQALDIVNLNPSINQRKIIELHVAKAKVYRAQKMYDQAFAEFKLAENLLHYNIADGSSFNQIKYPYFLLIVLDEIGATYLEQSKHANDPAALRNAYQYYSADIELMQYFKSGFRESSAKQFLQEDKFYIYENGIECSYRLYQQTDSLKYAEAAFYMAERSKAQLLREALRKSKAVAFAGLPDSLVSKEKDLRISLAWWQEERFNVEQGEAADEKLSGINGHIFELHQSYNSLMALFEQSYPEYYNLKHKDDIMSASDVIKNYVDPGMAIVEYFFGDSSIYRFDLSTDGINITAVEGVGEVKELALNFRKHISSYPAVADEGEMDAGHFATTAYNLYAKLFSGFSDSSISELLVIPDGILWYIPFDALLHSTAGQQDNFRSFDYLLHKFAISYTYAASMLSEGTVQHTTYRQGLLAMAPLFEGSQGLIADRSTNFARLDYNEPEALAIHKQLGGLAITGKDATRKAFLEQAGGFQILHLATHAEANDESGDYSYLAFAGDSLADAASILYVKDIYNLPLAADLVVLSACETGVGQISSGEGFISLGRAFSYAGASSILTTLWNINDATTAKLMQMFYGNLKSGQQKHVALRAAKKAYLNDSRVAAAHPYYWAAFVPLGDMAPLQINQPMGYLAWLGIGILAMGLLWLVYRYLLMFKRKAKARRMEAGLLNEQ